MFKSIILTALWSSDAISLMDQFDGSMTDWKLISYWWPIAISFARIGSGTVHKYPINSQILTRVGFVKHKLRFSSNSSSTKISTNKIAWNWRFEENLNLRFFFIKLGPGNLYFFEQVSLHWWICFINHNLTMVN